LHHIEIYLWIKYKSNFF